MEGPQETAIRALYEDDPFVGDVWLARMIEEAREQDRAAELLRSILGTLSPSSGELVRPS